MTLRELFIALGFKMDEKSEKEAEKRISNLKSFATKALGVIGIGFSLVSIKNLSEEFGGVNDQIRNATKGLGDLEDHQKKILDAANNARATYADMAKSVTKLVENSDGLFGSLDEAAQFSELTTKAFKSGNLAAAEISTLQDALNKSFAKGKVEAQTLTRIIEKSPAAANLLAKGLGVTRSEFTNMASSGKISLNQLKDAFISNADEINRDFGNLSYGISDALLNIRNQWGLWLAEMDDTPQGFSKKRLDTIMKEFHADLTEGWKADTSINPQSLLGVIVAHCSNAFAELWEVGEDTYFAIYPSSAEGSAWITQWSTAAGAREKNPRTIICSVPATTAR